MVLPDIRTSHFRFLQVVCGVFLILSKLMMGVFLRKLVDASFQEDTAALTQPSRPLLNFISLYDLSFHAVLGLATLCMSLLTVCQAMVTSWSLFKAANTG
jgi:succinate dehydrogenase hydrophobic anchor subunit